MCTFHISVYISLLMVSFDLLCDFLITTCVFWWLSAVLPDWAGCRPIGLLLIGLDRRITHWAGRQNLSCLKKKKKATQSAAFFFAFIFSYVILICSSSNYHSKIMCSAVINSFFLNITLIGSVYQRLVNQFTIFYVGEM